MINYTHLKIVLFCEIFKSGDWRTDGQHVWKYLPWLWTGYVDLFFYNGLYVFWAPLLSSLNVSDLLNFLRKEVRYIRTTKLLLHIHFYSLIHLAGSDYYFLICLPSVRPYFSKSFKAKQSSNENSDSYWWDCGFGQGDHWWQMSCFYSFFVGNYTLYMEQNCHFKLCTNLIKLQWCPYDIKYLCTIDPPGPGLIYGSLFSHMVSICTSVRSEKITPNIKNEA